MATAVTVVVLLAAGAVIALAAQTRGEPAPTLLPSGLRSVVPAEGAQSPRQGPIGVNMGPGWEVSLTVNDVSIPDEQLTTGTRQLGEFLYSPRPGNAVPDIQPGRNCASMRAINIVDEDVDPIAFSWCWTAF